MAEWHPNFGPSYTPMEMLDQGIFEGVYTHAIDGIPSKYKSHPKVLGNKGPDVTINRFGVKSRQSLKEWQKKGWTTKLSPLGWWEWYVKYFEGRRDEKEDKLQIARWNSFVARHMGQLKSNCSLSDLECSVKQRQGLLQWGWDSEEPYSDDAVQRNAKRLARLSKSTNLATEAFSGAPDLINLGLTLGQQLVNLRNERPKRKPTNKRIVSLKPSTHPSAYLPYVSVEEKDGVVDVHGFSMKYFAAGMQGILNTTRFKSIFLDTNSRGFRIESFFVIEILRTIELLLESKSSRIAEKTLLSMKERLIANTWVGKLKDAEPKQFNYNNLKRLNVQLLSKQREFLEEYATCTAMFGLDGWLLAAAPGTGKALKNGTKVRVIDGWSNIEDLKVGEFVIGQDGKPTKVTGVYPQGKVELYEITFYDGRKAVACKDHLWKINDGRLGKKPHDERWHVVNTENIYEYFKTSSRFRCSVPLSEPVELKPRRFDVDPYLLGCLLGDGTIGHSNIVLNKADEYIRERFEEATVGEYTTSTVYQNGLANGFRLVRVDKTRSGALMAPLKAMGLYGTVARDKFIPAKYFEGSIEQRWEMLRGLMDTDGTVDKKTATPSFCSMSLDLAKGVQRLVHSLGGIAKITEKQVNYDYVNAPESKVAYIVTIRHKEPENLFNLPRKKELCRPSQYSENLKLSIVDIKPVESDEATCISVDNEEKLFLMEGYVVTHNTLTGIAWHLVQEFDTTIYLVPNNSVDDVWEKTLYRFFDKVPSYWISRPNFKITGKEEFLVCHYEHLPKLLLELNKFKGRRMGLWVDESHNFNELSSQRTNQLIDMAKEYVEEAVLASGTPLKALGREVVPLFRIIDSKRFTPSVEDKFVRTFGSTRGAVLELLNYRLDRSSFKVSKHEVVDNEVNERQIGIKIPNEKEYYLSTIKTEIRKYVTERLDYYSSIKEEIVKEYFSYIDRYAAEMTDTTGYNEYLSAARQMHQKFNQFTDGELIALCGRYERERIIPWLSPTERKGFRKVSAKYKFPLLVVRGEALGRILTRRRIDCFKAMVPYAELEDVIDSSVKKTVIFTNYVEVLQEIGEHLEVMGYKPMLVYGDTNKDLKGTLSRFMNDPSANVIVATYDSLSTAVPLVEASTLVLFDSPFRNYIIEQTIARLDRLDQDTAIDVLRLFLDTGVEDNLSTRSIELAEWSKELVDSVMNLSKVDSRVLSTEDFQEVERVLATEHYSAHSAHFRVETPPEKLYYVSLVPLSASVIVPTYPDGSKFAKDNHIVDHWKYDAAKERVELYGSVIGAVRAHYHEWKDIINAKGTDGINFYVYECENTSDNEWTPPIGLVKARAVYDAHFTQAYWTFSPVQLSTVNSMFSCKVNPSKPSQLPRDRYWFHMDDSQPFVLIQAYGDEHVVEHSPQDLRVFEELVETDIIRTLGTEGYYESHPDRNSGHWGDDRDKLNTVLSSIRVPLYHVSFKQLPKTLKPRLPAGSELSVKGHHTTEPDIPRICFSESLEGAVRAVFPNIQKLAEEHGKEGLEFFVYKVDKGTENSWVPPWALVDAKFVHDAEVTKEWWAMSDVNIKPDGKILVTMDTDKDFLEYYPIKNKKAEHSPLDIEIVRL